MRILEKPEAPAHSICYPGKTKSSKSVISSQKNDIYLFEKVKNVDKKIQILFEKSDFFNRFFLFFQIKKSTFSEKKSVWDFSIPALKTTEDNEVARWIGQNVAWWKKLRKG